MSIYRFETYCLIEQRKRMSVESSINITYGHPGICLGFGGGSMATEAVFGVASPRGSRHARIGTGQSWQSWQNWEAPSKANSDMEVFPSH